MRSKQITYARQRYCFANRPGIASHLGLAVAIAAWVVSLAGCENAPANANFESLHSTKPVELTAPPANPEAKPEIAAPSTSVASVDDEKESEKPKRLKRGEMPEEWIEPQREQRVMLVSSSGSLDLTFDDLKFDIEVGQPFERSLLSEKLNKLDGKEITLGGYMKPSFKATGMKGFVFVRDDKECCFGPQAAIYDCVMVRLKKGTTTDYLVRPFKIRGKFYLKEYEGPDGTTWAIFNMKNASIEQ